MLFNSLRMFAGEIGWGTADVKPVDLLDDCYGPLLEHLARDEFAPCLAALRHGMSPGAVPALSAAAVAARFQRRAADDK